MYEVNRSVAIIRPKQPFLDWLKGLPGGFETEPTLQELRENGNALLVPAVDDIEELTEFIAENCIAMFEAELADWCEEDKQWPLQRSQALFEHWFDIEVHGVVTDLVAEPLERERFQPFALDDE